MASSPARVPFEAGRLNERIEIRRLTDTPARAGGQQRAWTTITGMESVPAEVIGQSGREGVIANTLQGVATFRITIRYRTGLKANDQVVWLTNGDMELNILAPPSDPTGRRQFLQILADTSSPQGAGG